jgi:hypothetical protein
LRKGRRYRSIPIDKSQNENKEDKEEKEPFENLIPPQVTEPNEKKIKQSGDQVILFLKLVNLRRFLFDDLWVKLFLLDENTITIETNKFLIGSS